MCMAISALFINLANTWPFSAFKTDDIKASNQLVQKLNIPEHTKQFVYAVRELESGAVIYVLCVQNLSERSADDVACLIRAVRPDAVVAQLGNYQVPGIESGEKVGVESVVPTTVFEVMKRCFWDKLDKENYERVAGALVLKEIFGVGFHGHFLAAKDVAKEIGSSFLVLESPFAKLMGGGSSHVESGVGNSYSAFASSLVSQNVVSSGLNNSQRFFSLNETHLQKLKSMSLTTNMDAAVLQLCPEICESNQPNSDYVPPPFAQPIYPLLTDLHAMFNDFLSIGTALAQVQRVFDDVNEGKSINTNVLSDVFTFRIAVEVLRVALNSAGRVPISRNRSSNKPDAADFSKLSEDEQSHAVLAQALRHQVCTHKSVVAVVDATCLEGIRMHWNTPVPKEVKDLVGELVTSCEDYRDPSNQSDDKKRLLTNNPVLAVGVGATAVVGASSLSKVVPASTVIKLLTFKVPAASLKLMAAESYKAVALVLSKTLGPFKIVVPGFGGSGAKSASTLKAIISTKKIRAITHCIVSSAEKNSFSAMKTAFYHIMRNRAIRPIGAVPWVTFGCSFATCAALLKYGDGLECAAESLPAASSIANLGRGIQSLHHAVEQTERSSLHKSLEAMMQRLKKAKFQ